MLRREEKNVRREISKTESVIKKLERVK